MISADPLFVAPAVEELLGRSLRPIPIEAACQELSGARVAVTGAGGSVGRDLIARLASLPVERVVAIDQHEASLFRLGRDLDGAVPLELRIADVRNQAKLERIFDETQPSVVFHFAAYKHVPFAEFGPEEFVDVNVLGTESVIAAARAAGVRHLLYPSSDKAVNPPSVYGATKRIAETMLIAAADQLPSLATHVVRYVNVLGSSGSFSETCAQRARAGESVTLTGEQMERYWMAMDEAVSLLWHSLALSSGSCTVLDTGDPIPVKTMAERIYRRAAPSGILPEFVLADPRPGERLAEELASANERLVPCGEDPVLRVEHGCAAQQRQMIGGTVDELRSLLAAGDGHRLQQQLMAFARQLQ